MTTDKSLFENTLFEANQHKKTNIEYNEKNLNGRDTAFKLLRRNTLIIKRNSMISVGTSEK